MRIIIAPLVFGWGCFMSRVLTRAVLFVVMITAGAMLAAVAAHPATHNIVAVTGYEPGTIIVRTGERRLLYVIDRGHALRFPVGVGREGQQWTGRAKVEGKYIEPAWAPPEVIRRDHPDLPKVIPGGSPRNPMGAAALTFSPLSSSRSRPSPRRRPRRATWCRCAAAIRPARLSC
jgi:lipoprotein-anchoring transpeptidase ErfK/SrfK